MRCLLWADDLVLFSTEFNHMQKQIDALDIYCNENDLHVNDPNTKGIYITTRESAPSSLAKRFAYRGTTEQYAPLAYRGL